MFFPFLIFFTEENNILFTKKTMSCIKKQRNKTPKETKPSSCLINKNLKDKKTQEEKILQLQYFVNGSRTTITRMLLTFRLLL